MTVTVGVTDYGDRVTSRDIVFDAGESWHVDDNEHLHVRSASKTHIATFPRGEWKYARNE